MKKLAFLLLSITFSALTFGQLNIEEVGYKSYSDDLSDIWGYADEEGNEYALVGTYSGLSIVDVTDPSNPTEVFFGTGAGSIWRDIKTWGDYAYVSNESFGGVYIVDLSPLPGGEITVTSSFTGNAYPFQSAHNLYIDETGKMYIFGADNGNGGAIICDLTSDPMNPEELGRFNTYYLHDGMARGDTLWGAAIYAGNLLAIDVSNPASPSIMGSVSTPGNFTHNCWVSQDGTHVFTTDEVSNGYIGAYDVSDLSNIIETDIIQTAPGTNVIPHNTHVIGDFLVTSYYTEGITIHDVSRPDNIFEVGHFDTSPGYSGSGYHGSWGAYPFLPSGNILASDIENGLYILAPTYIKATHVDGLVTDSVTGDPLFNVAYDVIGTDISGQTAFDGSFSFGTLENGTYDIEFTKDGYETKVVEGLVFENGAVYDLEVEMSMPGTTSVDENAEIELNAYPNPFNSELTISYAINSKSAGSTIQVMDVTGKLMFEQTLFDSKGKVILSNDLDSGVYFVRIANSQNQQFQMKRIIKM
ncbi:MAG: choice-of-anchor B family protein [Bacteroidales bacterium]|nr:choice-of-anchor B family protein [Bacteroidales bacterium]